MSAVLFKEDIKNEKEIQSSDALRTRKGMRVGAMDPDATSGLGTSDSQVGWCLWPREENQILLLEGSIPWRTC